MAAVEKRSALTQKPKDSFASILPGIFTILFLLGGVVSVVLLLLFGTFWLAENVAKWVNRISAIGAFIIIPISLLLVIFRRTRGWGGIGLFVSSFTIGAALWLWALIVAVFLAGILWTVAGLFFGGLGIVPIALIASLLQGEWAIFFPMLAMAIVAYALRYFGLFLIEKDSTESSLPTSEEKDSTESSLPTSEEADDWAERMIDSAPSTWSETLRIEFTVAVDKAWEAATENDLEAWNLYRRRAEKMLKT